MNIRERLYAVALERGLRETTVRSYEVLLERMSLLDLVDPDIQTVQDAIWTIDNPNTRRAAIIAVRSVTGLKIKIPRGVPRRYVLPDEDTLRLALMTSPHEPRGLLMMYAGLRVGEACAITSMDVSGDRLMVAKQVVEVHHTGKPTTRRIGPVKTHESIVVIPRRGCSVLREHRIADACLSQFEVQPLSELIGTTAPPDEDIRQLVLLSETSS